MLTRSPHRQSPLTTSNRRWRRFKPHVVIAAIGVDVAAIIDRIERKRAAGRRREAERMERERAGVGLATVAYKGPVLDLLVRVGLLPRHRDLFFKEEVEAALTEYLRRVPDASGTCSRCGCKLPI